MTSRIGDWFQTASGVQFYPLDPRPEDINIGDIVHGLAFQCRFNGHVSRFYSVAQHSVLVSRVVPPELALVGLLHDAAEAYTGDLIRPMKLALREHTTAFDDIEQRIEALVAEVFGLPFPWPAEVKHADNVVLATERRDLLLVQREWRLREEPLPERIIPLSSARAAAAFLGRYTELTGIEVQPMAADETPELADRGWSWERRRAFYLQAPAAHRWPADAARIAAFSILDLEHWAAENGLEGAVTRAMAEELERRAAKLAAAKLAAGTQARARGEESECDDGDVRAAEGETP